ncbi:aftiphilin isoform X2 [Engystomops pustulosus]|uniref:aftiphilin isoform X2 n=1 Tax=Engystomops pustulosus TaxID=76066 RepID=UPI003AFA2B5A
MEPEIIRMYSSSPPPLDSVADDDDDDGFGEFGGFSDVNSSGIGFADFDSVGYPKTREDFIPSKHFLPIHDYTDNVNNFSSLTSITANENISEIGITKKGPCSVFETDINHEATQLNVSALDNKGSSGENAKYLNSETHLTRVDNVMGRSQEQIVSTCNGEKIHSLENLTNGFAVVDGDNPQGLQDLNSLGHSKGFKSISSHSTDLSIDFSPPSPGEDFADFAAFSCKDPVDSDEAQLDQPKGSHEGQTESIECSTESSRFEHSAILTAADELQDPFPEEEPDTLALDSFPPQETTSTTLDSDSMQSLDVRNATQLTQSEKEEEQTSNTISSASHESLETSKDGQKVELDCEVKSPQTLASREEPELEAFGDFDAAVPVTGQVTLDKEPVHEPLELPPSVTEVSDDDFGSFEDTKVDFQEGPDGQSEKLSPEEDIPSEQLASEEPVEFSDFGGFVSLPKNEDLNAKQDSDDFAEFNTVDSIERATDWNAFDEDQGGSSSSWAAFGDDEVAVPSSAESDDWQSFRTDVPSSIDDRGVNTESIDLPAVLEPATTLVSEDPTIAFQNPLLSRLERVIQACFSPPPVAEIDEKISPLDLLLCTEQQKETSKSTSISRLPTEVLDIWPELQDIHDAYGLKYQWGGSHSNKKLLRSLGIDTRNILFTGNKKQPVIVPMYAAGLGMLEPTKEPLKPLSAAEKIASIGQSSPVPTEDSVCSSEQLQESLPPVQFDWSSSGLTNPLDGVDPELYALTTAKVETSNAGSKVTDAFARLMSTAETTSTSARKPRRDENLSDEAAKVIASLPDLSFMHAKVLMFPVSLTPLSSSQDKVD